MEAARITGGLLGLALGDACGAPYEGGPMEQALWSVLGCDRDKACWTDDTQMSIDLVESLLACGGVDQDHLAHCFARSYSWRRGYGRGAAIMLKAVRAGQPWQEARSLAFADGSYGNGAAMRAPVIGLFYAKAAEEHLVRAAEAAAEITHAHPLGREGAVLIALATALALGDHESLAILDRLLARAAAPPFREKLHTARTWLAQEDDVPVRQVAGELGNGIAAANSCVTAIYLGLRFRPRSFNELLSFIIHLGGDADTIGAMAGAIWGAANGEEKLPADKLARLEQQERLRDLGRAIATRLAG